MRIKEWTWFVEDEVESALVEVVVGLVACSLKEKGISRREESSPFGKVKKEGGEGGLVGGSEGGKEGGVVELLWEFIFVILLG